jgi:SPOR domain
MADDQRYRSSRSERYLQHRASTGTPGRPSGDPLAELARLIGQDDGLASEPRNRTRITQAPQPDPARTSWAHRAAEDDTFSESSAGSMGRSRYADLDAAVRRSSAVPYASEEAYCAPDDLRLAEADRPSTRLDLTGPSDDIDHDYVDQRMSSYDGEYAERLQDTGEEEEATSPYESEDLEATEDDYQPAQPEEGYARRAGPRAGLLTIATVFGLALVGTAGAFGYRTWTAASTATPPIIKASPEPAKVMVPNPSEAAAGQQAFDRTEKPGPSEQIVPREEEPVSITTRSVAPRPGSGPTAFSASPPAPGGMQPAPLSGGTPSSGEPRKVHTITIRPDLSSGTESAGADPGVPLHTSTIAPFLAPTNPPPGPASPPSGPPSREKAQARKSATAAPNQAADAADGPSPRTAVSGTAQSGRTALLPNAAEVGHYVVQVSAQRSETEAESSFRSLQTKYPSVLGGRQPLINRADKGDKGIFYRAQVGPFATVDEANTLCSSLKAAGGQCFVYRM